MSSNSAPRADTFQFGLAGSRREEDGWALVWAICGSMYSFDPTPQAPGNICLSRRDGKVRGARVLGLMLVLTVLGASFFPVLWRAAQGTLAGLETICCHGTFICPMLRVCPIN